MNDYQHMSDCYLKIIKTKTTRNLNQCKLLRIEMYDVKILSDCKLRFFLQLNM